GFPDQSPPPPQTTTNSRKRPRRTVSSLENELGALSAESGPEGGAAELSEGRFEDPPEERSEERQQLESTATTEDLYRVLSVGMDAVKNSIDKGKARIIELENKVEELTKQNQELLRKVQKLEIEKAENETKLTGIRNLVRSDTGAS
ncbi:1051_t:CDS:2, partial [Racocetra persica]